MGSRQRQRVVQTYGRHKLRVVTVDPWSSGDSKPHLFSSFSSDDSSLSHNASACSERNNRSRNNKGRACKKQPPAPPGNIFNLADSSSSSNSSISHGANSSGGRDDHSRKVLRDRTNIKPSRTAKTRKAPPQRKTNAGKRKRQPVGMKPKAAKAAEVSISDLSTDAGPNFSDMDKYSLIMSSDSPLVERAETVDEPKAATSLVQTSTPHVGRPSSVRLSSVAGELSIAAGSPINSPAMIPEADDPQVMDCSRGISKLHVSDMSIIACDHDGDGTGDTSLGESFSTNLSAKMTNVSTRRKRIEAPILRLHASQNTRSFQSEFNASESLFDPETSTCTTNSHIMPPASLARLREKLSMMQRVPSLPAGTEVDNNVLEETEEDNLVSDESDTESDSECEEDSEEELSDIEEVEVDEEEEEEEEEEEDGDEEDTEDMEEDECSNCSLERSKRKSSLQSDVSDGNTTRYTLAEDCDAGEDSPCESDLSSSAESLHASYDASEQGEECSRRDESFTRDPEDMSCETPAGRNTHETPVRRNTLSHLLTSDKCLAQSPMLLLTPIRLHKTGRLATDDEKVLFQCEQDAPISFSTSIPPRMIKSCVKIGEGTFGEVFKATKKGKAVALKIIPIEGSQAVNDEPQKSYGGILTEIVISKQLSALREDPMNATESFVCVNDVSLVQGCYPDALLKQWDLFQGTQNDRPDYFDSNQLFIVFDFEECGCAMESFQFATLSEARSVLHQVTCALAVAESALQFEHRDLHIGNVLIKRTREPLIHYTLQGEQCTLETCGVKVAIIDFTLSRLTHENVSVHTNLGEDEELFQGHGDYQFDIYRLMREHNEDDWAKFTPSTNVLWIHYLAQKLSSLKYPKADQRLSRQFRNFQREALEFFSALHLLKQSPLFEES